MARILVIDDVADLREFVTAWLAADGHEVFSLPNGRSADKLVGERAIDLVITDIFMPDQEGLETIVQLRARHPRVKIIAMTGGGNIPFITGRMEGKADLLSMASHFGAAATLKKPFSRRELIEVVEVVIALK